MTFGIALTYTLAQINPTVGALEENAEKIRSIWSKSQNDLVIFPELCLVGYPPDDLILRPEFINKVDKVLLELIRKSKDFPAAAIIGATYHQLGKTYNAAYLIEKGEILAVQCKRELPNYGVFDDKRIFAPGDAHEPIPFRGHKLGIMICEDMWHKQSVADELAKKGADLLIVINASPFIHGKKNMRMELAKLRVNETKRPLIYVNQVGGQDELTFDGGSFVLDKEGRLITQMPFFHEAVGPLDLNAQPNPNKAENDPLADIYSALKLGVRDYIVKNGFSGAVIGLSGGIDSALAACIAVDALGAENVRCVMMPSPYTSQDSLDDAAQFVENLGCPYDIISIKDAMAAFENTIKDLSGLAYENMQSRTRGLILMSLSNMSGKLLITTGNKSELAVGYSTLYGDMCGAFNPLKDVYKTLVYKLCAWRNEQAKRNLIPINIITKPPSAELKDNQTDQDSLPPYDILDDILEKLIENQQSQEEICKAGHDPEVVKKVTHLLYNAEYKRYQAPPGTVITECAFGRDRRYPLTNKYRS